MFENTNLKEIVILLGGYIILLVTSGKIVYYILSKISSNDMQEISSNNLNMGFVIGKCENILILTFMILEA
jgi:hypothetical protein